MTNKRLLVGFASGILFLLMLYLVFSYSFLLIEVSDSQEGNISYRINRSGDLKQDYENTGSKTIKKFVKRGSYEIVVRQGDKSYYSVTDSERFLRTKKVKSSLTAEKEREFVGDNPLGCIYLVVERMLSNECGDSIANTQVHVPATSSQPTSPQKARTPLSGFVEGAANTEEGVVVLVKNPASSREEGAPHTTYLLQDDGNTIEGIAMNELSSDGLYAIKPYKKGFIVYRENHNDVYYYKNRTSKPELISLPSPKPDTLGLRTVHVLNDSLLAVYSTTELEASSDIISAEGIEAHSIESELDMKKAKSVAILLTNDQSRSYSFNVPPSALILCDEEKLCSLHDGALDVYSLSGKKPKQLFELSGITDIEVSTNGVLLVHSEGIVRLDLDRRSGSFEYTFGDYVFCGIKNIQTDYLVCVENSIGGSSVLKLDPSRNNTTNIDKKIHKLLGLEEVAGVSVYGNFVHVSPNLGDLVYRQDIGGFDYDPTTRKNINELIYKKIDELGIDRNVYKVINALDY